MSFSKSDSPHLSRFAFWDIDPGALDFERFADFIIIRVFERGNPEDIQKVLGYYAKPRIIDSLTKASFLQPRAIALAKKIFGLSQNQFSCSRPLPQAMSYSKY